MKNFKDFLKSIKHVNPTLIEGIEQSYKLLCESDEANPEVVAPEEHFDYSSEIREAMAKAFFATAWADYEEQVKHESLAQTEIMDVLPDNIPESAYAAADNVIGTIEKSTGRKISDLYNEAKEAPGDHYKEPDEDSFGHYLAMQAMGHGVSWSDDHPDLTFDVPRVEYSYYDLPEAEYPIKDDSEETEPSEGVSSTEDDSETEHLKPRSEEEIHNDHFKPASLDDNLNGRLESTTDKPAKEMSEEEIKNDSDIQNILEAEKVSTFLNKLLESDPEAMKALFSLRVPCNKALADHPTVVVRDEKDGMTSLGVLGLINGLVKLFDPKAVVAAEMDDDGNGDIYSFSMLNNKAEKDSTPEPILEDEETQPQLPRTSQETAAEIEMNKQENESLTSLGLAQKAAEDKLAEEKTKMEEMKNESPSSSTSL